MAELCVNGLEISILIPLEANGFAIVSSLRRDISFGLQYSSMWVEREVCDLVSCEVSHTLPVLSIMSDDGSTAWKLNLGRYRIYGLTTSQMALPTQLLTTSQSLSYTIITLTAARVKMEPRV